MSDTQPYVEDENFVPDPTAQYGTLDTSGTAGAAHSKIEDVSPVFAVADQQNAAQAARALDPDDDSVHSSLVVLPDSDRTYDEAVETVQAKAEKAASTKVALVDERETPAQKQAAESGAEAGALADAQTADHGAAGGLDGSGTGQVVNDGESKDDEGSKAASTADDAKSDKDEKKDDEKKSAAKKTASSNKS